MAKTKVSSYNHLNAPRGALQTLLNTLPKRGKLVVRNMIQPHAAAQCTYLKHKTEEEGKQKIFETHKIGKLVEVIRVQ